MIDKIIDKLKDKKIAILGFGLEGKSTYKFLRKNLKDQVFTIIDKEDQSENDLVKDDDSLLFYYGEEYLDNLDEYDLIIKTPGISLKDLDLTKIKDKITSQLELILEVFSSNIIGITGTKGKSTTSSLIYEVLKSNGVDTYLLGNIGNPIFDEIDKYNDDTKLVIEMSSHQLEFINVSPHIGIILNLFEDHLDHAGSVKHYHENKLNMFKYMSDKDICIYCSDNETLNNYVENNNYKGKKISVSLGDLSDTHIANEYVFFDNKKIYDINLKRNLIGNHNLENIMVALTVSELLNLDISKSTKAVNEFKPLEHRMEYVGTFNNILFYNDSIATIPNATINAIESLGNVNTLIFGGMDRGINYDILVDYLNKCNVDNLICMPTTGHKIGELINNKNVIFVDTLEEAVKEAKKVTKDNMICLLSPAASSYEYFKNFEEKGRKYKELVKKSED